MRNTRLDLAIARQSRIRRSRDVGWMLFAAAASAGLYGWISAVIHLMESPIDWIPVVIYVVLGAVGTYAAYRLYQASMALNRRLKAAEDLSTLSAADREPDVSVWSEMFPSRRRGD